MAKRRKAPKASKKKVKANPLRIDPSRTGALRKQFTADLRKRFRKFRLTLVQLIRDEDALGLAPPELAINEREDKEPKDGDKAPTLLLPRTITRNARWGFASDSEKLKQFQSWIRQQTAQQLQSPSEEALWRSYIAEGHRKGGARAFDDARRPQKARAQQEALRNPESEETAIEAVERAGRQRLDFYNGTKEEFLRSSFGGPVAEEKVKLLASRSFTELEGVTDDMAVRMTRTLTDGLVRGDSPREVARLLADEVDVTEERAERIARTEIIRAHAEGQLTALEDLGVEEVGVMVEWVTAGDDKVCPLCEALEGVVMRIEEARGLLPRHPQCLPGDCLVTSRSGIAAVSKRLYNGDLIVFRTAAGRELSCTPNHPILTDRGWIAAQSLDLGSYVICDGGIDWEPLVDDQHKNVPTRIEEVASAFRRSRKVMAAEVPTASPDFHGDGMDGDVAIVWSDRQLGNAIEAPSKQPPHQSLFERRDGRLTVLSDRSAGDQFRHGGLPSPACVVCGSDLPPSLVLTHSGPFDRLGLGLIAAGDIGQFQDASDGGPGHVELEGDSVLRLSGKVERYDQLAREIGRPSDGTVFASQNANDDLVRDAELSRKLLRGDACPVFADEVVSKTIQKFYGHVYNLQTGEGHYTAAGIITHNCRCAWVPANVGEDERGQVRGQEDVEEALEDSGIDDVEISVSRPRSVFNSSGGKEEEDELAINVPSLFLDLQHLGSCPHG